jgi:hypothetical protein
MSRMAIVSTRIWFNATTLLERALWSRAMGRSFRVPKGWISFGSIL